MKSHGISLLPKIVNSLPPFLSSADFFQIIFLEKFFQEYHLSVGPDLGPICLQRL